jgi:hypothetical protein
MGVFEDLHNEVANSVSKAARKVARWIWDLRGLGKIGIQLLAIVYLSSLGFEMGYSSSPVVRVFGWLWCIICGVFVLVGVYKLFTGSNSNLPEGPYVWLICLVFIVAIFALIKGGVEFKSAAFLVTKALLNGKTSASEVQRVQQQPAYDMWPTVTPDLCTRRGAAALG